MKKILTLGLALFVMTAMTASAHDKNAPLNDSQKSFLAKYEVVRAALAADDLSTAKKGAEAITAPPAADSAGKEGDGHHFPDYVVAAKKLAEADSLESARESFKVLSKRAVHLAGNQKGYFHAHCPMVPNDEGDWVQTNKKISNPYLGQAMPSCGSIEN